MTEVKLNFQLNKLKNNILIKKIIKKLFFKNKIDYSNLTVEIDDRSREYVKSAGKFSLKSEVEMWTIICCLRNLLNQNVDGDIVETGVWKGGTLILLKKILDEFNIKKNIFGFDTFEDGFDEPSEFDKKIKYNNINNKNLFVKNFDYKNFETCSLEDALNNIKNNCSIKDDIFLIKGKVQKTLENKNLNKIAFLLLDTDYYDSTKFTLDKLYDKVVYNGIIYIDDYGNWNGARKAVDEFFLGRKIKPFLIRTSFSSRIFIKNI